MKFHSFLISCIFTALGLLLISGDTLVICFRRHVAFYSLDLLFLRGHINISFHIACLVTIAEEKSPSPGFSSECVVFDGVTTAISFQANSHLLNMTPCHHLSLWRPRNLTYDLVLAVSVAILSFRRQRCCWCVLRASHVGSLLGEIIRLLA